MSYAIRNDGQGWRAVNSPDDVGADETYMDSLPPTPYHRVILGEWVLDAERYLADLRTRQLTAIKVRAAGLLATLSASYPEGEVQSWAQQTREAEALAVDPNAAAPLLTAIASARGLTVPDLAERVRTKVQAYAVASGQIIGQRQALEDALMVVDLAAPDAVAQLEAIQWLAVA